MSSQRRVAESESCGSFPSSMPAQLYQEELGFTPERLLQLSYTLHSRELTASPDHELFWDNIVNLSGLCVIHCR